MKLFSALAFALLLTGSAFAQETISASATVLDAITFGTHQNLLFGEVIAGQTTAIAADSSAAGYFEITGYENTKDLDVSVAQTSPSFGGTGTVTLTLATLNYNFAASANAGTSTAVTAGTIDLASQTTNLYLYVGGTLDASAATSGGSFTSTIELTVDYL